MDKIKSKTLEEVRKKIGLQMQDRRIFLNKLLEIEDREKSIELKKRHIEKLKTQLDSEIREKNKFNEFMTKDELVQEILFQEMQLKQFLLNLDYAKEDLYFILNVNEGVIAKAGSLKEVKPQINAHFNLMREEYEKLKKVMEDAV